jgi:hypothetical protein
MLDDAIRKLHALQHRLQALEGRHSVPATEMFPDEFILRNTDFQSLEQFFNASSWRIETAADLEAVPDAEWDEYVKMHTRFGSWEEMQRAAGQEWIARQLDLEA